MCIYMLQIAPAILTSFYRMEESVTRLAKQFGNTDANSSEQTGLTCHQSASGSLTRLSVKKPVERSLLFR